MQLYKIDQYFECHFSTQRFDTGAATDADALPTYRVYEENNDTVLDSGNCSKVDDAGTTGYYKARAQATVALGYEVGKVYHVRVAATVNSVAGAGVVGRFSIIPAKVWDSLSGGTDNLEIDTIQIAGAAVSTSTAQLGVNTVSLSNDAITAASLQDGAIDAATFAAGAITAAAVATDAIDADALAADAITEIVLALLKTDWTGITGEAARSMLNALRFIRNKWSITGTTLTVTKEDDTTAAWTAALTTDAASDPVTGVDPAGP